MKTPKWMKETFQDLSNSLIMAEQLNNIKIMVKNSAWKNMKKDLGIDTI